MSTAEEMEAGRKRNEYFANLGRRPPAVPPNKTSGATSGNPFFPGQTVETGLAEAARQPQADAATEKMPPNDQQNEPDTGPRQTRARQDRSETLDAAENYIRAGWHVCSQANGARRHRGTAGHGEKIS